MGDVCGTCGNEHPRGTPRPRLHWADYDGPMGPGARHRRIERECRELADAMLAEDRK